VSRWEYDPRESERGRDGREYERYPKVPIRDHQVREVPREGRELRQVYREHDKEYRLNSAEIAVIRDVGSFRTISARDLAKFIYNGKQDAADRSLRHLANEKLVRVSGLPGRARTKYVTLTKTGKELVNRQFNPNRKQQIHSGLKKPRELKHDAALYRMYKQEAERMGEHGCRPKRVVLDYELKRDVQRDLARARKEYGGSLVSVREEVARKHNLPIVDNQIRFPDVRIEYEGPDHGLSIGGDSGSVDLEYVSDHYKPGQVAAKARAGFSLYIAGSGGGRSGRSPYGPDLIMSVLR